MRKAELLAFYDLSAAKRWTVEAKAAAYHAARIVNDGTAKPAVVAARLRETARFLCDLAERLEGLR